MFQISFFNLIGQYQNPLDSMASAVRAAFSIILPKTAGVNIMILRILFLPPRPVHASSASSSISKNTGMKFSINVKPRVIRFRLDPKNDSTAESDFRISLIFVVEKNRAPALNEIIMREQKTDPSIKPSRLIPKGANRNDLKMKIIAHKIKSGELPRRSSVGLIFELTASRIMINAAAGKNREKTTAEMISSVISLSKAGAL